MITKTVIFKNKEFNFYFKNKNNNGNVLFVFLNGINAEANIIDLYNHKIFKNNQIVTFDNIAHYTNKFKSTISLKKYLNFTKDVIDYIKLNFLKKNQKFVIIGESFGASLGLLLSIHFPNLANLFFVWNAPSRIVKNKKMPNKLSISFKTAFTYFFRIETKTIGFFDERLTSNQALIRINRLKPKQLVSTKLNIVCWKCIRSIKKILNKIQNNVILVQSKEDILFDNKKIKYFTNRNNIIILNNGYHILSLERNVSNSLFELLQKAINNVNF